jgi:Zn-dependent protease
MPRSTDTPFGTGFPLGSWKGVAIRAHWSVLIVLGLFAWLLASSLLPVLEPGQAAGAYWAVGVVTATLFLASLLAHELAHAVTARHFGMRVERITLWMLGGMAELDGQPPSPRADALIAGAGPLTSLVVGAVCGALAWVLGGGLIVAALTWLAEISVILAVFNLLPGAPLDGGRLLRAALWRRYRDRARATRAAASAGRVLGWLLVALGLLEVLAGGPFGLWLALVGWFVITGANSERYSVQAERLRGLAVRDAIGQAPATAGDWWSVQQFLDHLTPQHAGQPGFPLVDVDGRLTGLVTVAGLEKTPPGRRATTLLRDVPSRPPVTVQPDTPLPELLLSLHLRGGIAVVVQDGRPIGVLNAADLDRAVELTELGWGGKQPPSGEG